MSNYVLFIYFLKKLFQNFLLKTDFISEFYTLQPSSDGFRIQFAKQFLIYIVYFKKLEQTIFHCNLFISQDVDLFYLSIYLF